MKISKLVLVFICLTLSSCSQSNTINQPVNVQIDDFKLSHLRPNGDKLFDLKTPIAIIDESKDTVNSINTVVRLFKENEPIYLIKSDSSIISENGNKLYLKGNVILTNISNTNLKVRSNSLNWDSKTNTINISGNVIATMNSSTLLSNKAAYEIDNDIITFTQIKKYESISTNKSEPSIAIISDKAVWKGSMNKLEFSSTNRKVRSKVKFNKFGG